MNLKLEWQKIVVNAMSVFVAAIILGAAGIVWQRAMSVDEKVQESEKSQQHLVDALSQKLASYEVQLTAISNQLAGVIRNQNDLLNVSRNNAPVGKPFTLSPPNKTEDITQTKARSIDIRQQLEYKK